MSEFGDITVVERDGVVVAECPRCDEMVELYGGGHDCDGEMAFDGVCPMCGQAYESYLGHLKDCSGG